jgi:aspartyl protease family protein
MRTILIGLIVLLFPLTAGAVEKVSLFALFKGKAIIMVDGQRRVVATGEATPEGIRLISTDTETEEAELEINGRTERLKLGIVHAPVKSGGKGNATIFPDRKGQFFADGSINNVPVQFLVDTGASSIAMSSAHANRIGIDYRRNGKRGYATTASGVVPMYGVTLQKVQVGDITLHGVEAGVIEGNFPVEILLGMSFLGQVDMRHQADRLELHER